VPAAAGPRPSPAYADDGPTARVARPRRDAVPAEERYVDDDYEEPPRHTGRRRRRLTWRVIAFVVVLLAVVGGALATIQWYGGSGYFVGLEGDQVAIYKGRPGGLLWIQPKLVEVTDLDIDRVPESRRHDIEDGKQQPSLGDARRYVANVSERADELDPPTTTTTTAPTTTTTLAPPGLPASPPASIPA